MDFKLPTGGKAVSVRVTKAPHVFEMQSMVVDHLEQPDDLMKQHRLSGAVANCYADDVALTLYFNPTQEAKTLLLRQFVHNRK